jgi:hypothetical protein
MTDALMHETARPRPVTRLRTDLIVLCHEFDEFGSQVFEKMVEVSKGAQPILMYSPLTLHPLSEREVHNFAEKPSSFKNEMIQSLTIRHDLFLACASFPEAKALKGTVRPDSLAPTK